VEIQSEPVPVAGHGAIQIADLEDDRDETVLLRHEQAGPGQGSKI